MKEHRAKALRVTTPQSIESNDGHKDKFIGRENANDLFGALQMLQFEYIPASCQTATTSQKSYTYTSATPSRLYSQSKTMTLHSATITANPVLGKHDSFYQWFSSEFENEYEEQSNQRNYAHQELCCDNCNDDNQDDQISDVCHCRSTFPKMKLRHKKSTSIDISISRSLPLFHSRLSHTIMDIMSGDLCESWFLKLRNIKEVIRREKSSHPHHQNEWCNLKDANGNTMLLVIGQWLLKDGQFDKTLELVRLFLEEGADVNVMNNENRTLLSYSILFMDKSIQLTTFLLNYGANIWHIRKYWRHAALISEYVIIGE